jgi:hypothetical protein
MLDTSNGNQIVRVNADARNHQRQSQMLGCDSPNNSANEGAKAPDIPLNEGARNNSPSVYEGDEDLRMPTMMNLRESGLRCSPCLQNRRTLSTILTAALSSTLISETIYNATNGVSSTIEQMNSCLNQIDQNFDGTFNSFMTHVFAAGKDNNEVYTFHEMLKQDDRDQFVDAMEKEIQDHTR